MQVVALSGNTLTISENKSNFKVVEVEKIKVGCSSVLDKSSAKIIDYQNNKYLQYENGVTIRVDQK